MGLSETKRLLRTFRITPNKLLGQNFMVEPALYPKLCEYACLSKTDVVLDAGAGFGFLAKFLADKCKVVVAVEKDPRIASVLREQVKGCANVTVVEGDVLKVALPAFNKVVAIPPYYMSSRLAMWLLEQKTDCAVLVLQKEFAARLVASVGSEDYGWLTVLAYHQARVELLESVLKSMFYPQPAVDSVIVRFSRWEKASFEVKREEFFKRLVRWLFTQRNKKACKALVLFLKNTCKMSEEEAEKLASAAPFGDRRVRELSPEGFGRLADALGD
jgi:16S rRNA (adenine1518-N6/adenine1519-N6)-dimethyltransferase